MILLHTNTKIYYTYIVPNTSVGKSKKTQNNLSTYFSWYFIGRLESTLVGTYLNIILLTLSKFEMMDSDK